MNCSHLFQRRWRKYVKDFGIEDINSPKNILLLFKPIEVAFDSGRLVFIYNKSSKSITCKILDPRLKKKKLYDSAKDLFSQFTEQMALDLFGGTDTTFSSLDGKQLTFLNDNRPWIRCITVHALIARDNAMSFNWIREGDLDILDQDDVWSDDYLDEEKRRIIDEWRKDVAE